MSVKLWHFTQPANIDSIKANGFHDGRSGLGVYFTMPGVTWWDAWGEPFEVTLDLNDEDLVPYSSEIVNDEEWCAETGAFVKTSDPARIYRRVDYRLPAGIVNAHIKAIRPVPEEALRHDR